MLNVLIDITERGFVPTPLIRLGVRRLCAERLDSLTAMVSKEPQMVANYAKTLKQSPVAVATKEANEQHYEVPTEFFLKVLGPYRKYSCAYWDPDCHTLEQAEKRSLDITIDRAQIHDGMRILELGCGWGSLTLEMARRFPKSKIVAISNSATQKKFILDQATSEGLGNLQVLTKDVSTLETIGVLDDEFDRVVSVEMFEHFRNYEILLQRISRWMAPTGKLFIHIFTHRQFPYFFETEGSDNWMGKYFFTGGQMPSHSLLQDFQNHLHLENSWSWSGTHYQKTSEAWLANHKRQRDDILNLFSKSYGSDEAVRWYYRWQIFFVSVAELFGYKNGSEWGVSHYLFSQKK